MITPQRILVALSALGVSGCASVNPTPAFHDVQRTVAGRTGQRVEWMQTLQVPEAVEPLLQKELTADSTVQIALLNNRALQATLEEIGISQAELAQATRLKNPEFAASWRFPDRPPSAVNTEYSIAQDFLDLIILPLRKKVAAQQLEQAKARVAHEVLKLVADAKSAFYTVQGRQQLIDRLRLILEANEAAADLAKAQFEAGTLNELDFQSQQASYNQSKRDLAQAQLQLRSDRERLNRLLGLAGHTDWKVAGQLPAMPQGEIALEGLEALAVEQRLDLAAARQQVALLNRAVSLNRSTRILPTGVTIGVDTERESNRQRVTGPTLALSLPVFDQGQAALAKLSAQLRQSERQGEALTTEIRSEVREAHALMSANHELAKLYGDVLLPQRQRIVGLTLEHYNFMLKGTYDLLLVKQNELETERSYIEAWRDYWVARTQLERAVGGRLPETESKSEPETEKPPQEKVEPPPAPHQHEH